jgi:hypothetical protein
MARKFPSLLNARAFFVVPDVSSRIPASTLSSLFLHSSLLLIQVAAIMWSWLGASGLSRCWDGPPGQWLTVTPTARPGVPVCHAVARPVALKLQFVAIALALQVQVACFGVSHGVTVSEEVAALVDLYSATDGPSWRLGSSWMSGDPCSQAWDGVQCNGEHIVYVCAQVDS